MFASEDQPNVFFYQNIWKSKYTEHQFNLLPKTDPQQPEYELKFTLQGLTRLSEIYFKFPLRATYKKYGVDFNKGVPLYWNPFLDFSTMPQGSNPFLNVIDQIDIFINDHRVTQDIFNQRKFIRDVYRKTLIREPEEQRQMYANGLIKSNNISNYSNYAINGTVTIASGTLNQELMAKQENCKMWDNYWKELNGVFLKTGSLDFQTGEKTLNFTHNINVPLKEIDPCFNSDIGLPANTKIRIRLKLIKNLSTLIRLNDFTDTAGSERLKAITEVATGSNQISIGYFYNHLFPDMKSASAEGLTLFWPVKEYKLAEYVTTPNTLQPWGTNSGPNQFEKEFVIHFLDEIPEKLYLCTYVQENDKVMKVVARGPYFSDNYNSKAWMDINPNNLVPMFVRKIQIFYENSEYPIWTLIQEDNKVNDQWQEGVFALQNLKKYNGNYSNANGYQNANFIEINLNESLDLLPTTKKMSFIKIKVTLSESHYLLGSKPIFPPTITNDTDGVACLINIGIVEEFSALYYLTSKGFIRKSATLIQ